MRLERWEGGLGWIHMRQQGAGPTELAGSGKREPVATLLELMSICGSTPSVPAH